MNRARPTRAFIRLSLEVVGALLFLALGLFAMTARSGVQTTALAQRPVANIVQPFAPAQAGIGVRN